METVNVPLTADEIRLAIAAIEDAKDLMEIMDDEKHTKPMEIMITKLKEALFSRRSEGSQT